MWRYAALAMIAGLVPGCSGRPETPAYFTEVTGLYLCPGAKVKNVEHPSEEDAGTGFIYTVDLTLDESCRDELFSQLEEVKSRVASGNAKPNDRPGAGETMKAEVDGDKVRFTYIG